LYAGEDRNPDRSERHKSPLRQLGDCDVAYQLDKSQAQAAWHAGWRFGPQSPGSRPGLVCG
jgi:hypothetical protein